MLDKDISGCLEKLLEFDIDERVNCVNSLEILKKTSN